MIFIDTETTGLLKPSANELAFQPYIIELCAIKVDDDYNLIDEVNGLVKPPVPIPDFITRITGIDDSMVINAPPFVAYYDRLVDLFLGEREVVGHNVTFDMNVLWVELARLELELRLPWPPVWTCTVEKSLSLEGKRLKLTDLHQHATGSAHDEGRHRARHDVIALIRSHIWLRNRGLL